MADIGSDAERIRGKALKVGMTPGIHPNPSRKQPPTLDRSLYRVACFFHAFKRFRAAGTHYDKTAKSYLLVLHVDSMLLWLR
ncbi:hypothetical protein [Corallococcus aberystwythensis]|uniref:Transposase DDE domain-containing protein n=1 Tax=Corallococcus aberystwythensis TaxID=2316722 RepID=A0A3A8QP14_9BACT|nr:hypothetical protein [Corallococcus aberystwythensis]RKH68620.1 hypothetical protein D7W81_12275 [Corallococcus aberystwythensis]